MPPPAGASPFDDLPMTAAELRVAIEFLGIDQRALAEILGEGERQIRRWIAGTHLGSDRYASACARIEEIEAYTADMVGIVVTALNDMADPLIVVHRTDDDMHADRPEFAPYPASWWRAVAGRAAHEVPGLRILYREDVE